MNKRFENKTVIVTGASMGIGRAVALAFGREGAGVVVADVAGDEGRKTADEIRADGGNAIFAHCDISNPEDVRTMVETTVETFGRLDHACNNAGIEGDQASSTADCTLENWDRVVNTNLRGTWLCMKYEIPKILEAGGGSIVNIASIAGLVGFPGIPAYTASKHGIVGLTKNAALEYAQQNIRVNAVCPGGIRTPMLERFARGNEAAMQQLNSMHPIGRAGNPEEIAHVVLWLCSDEASFVTGEAVAVDGGYVAQ